jgi:hypothetical protein
MQVWEKRKLNPTLHGIHYFLFTIFCFYSFFLFVIRVLGNQLKPLIRETRTAAR